MIDPKQIRADFPLLVNNPDLVYLDSSATSLRPRSVIQKITEYYEQYGANIHRGLYKISEKATEEYEQTRTVVAQFIGAHSSEIIFTRNTTESLNLIAYSLGRDLLTPGSEVVTTVIEHHSNFVPWQQLAFENGVDFKVIDVDDEGMLTNVGRDVISKRTKLLALTYVSNSLGTINPVKRIIAEAKQLNPEIIIVVDAAQAIQKFPIDVQELGCDFLAFSSHKMLGPTGVGVLWGKAELLDRMYPFLYGGEMIEEVTIEQTIFKKSPHKFEAGTPDIGGVIALREAIAYIQQFSWEDIRAHDKALLTYTMDHLKHTFGNDIQLLGPHSAEHRSGSVAFTLKGMHPHDIAQLLDEKNIAVRAGNHCAMPAHTRYGVPASTRASFYIYNSTADIDRLIEGLQRAKKILMP